MTTELMKKFQEMANIIYENDESAIQCAMENAATEGDLFICFYDYSAFEARYSEIEEACWARNLIIAPEGKGYVIKEDK